MFFKKVFLNLPRFIFNWFLNLYKFLRDFFVFRRLTSASSARFSVSIGDVYPCLTDRTSTTPFDRHYIYHTAWAARKVHQILPKEHIDISSSLYFVSIVSAFVPVRFFDYRPAKLALSNFTSEQGDLNALPFADDSVESISCMHTIEHVGLGRYGDPLDPDGDVKAIHELKRVTKHGGHILFVVPVGKPKIMFNAHRVYSYDQVLELFDGCVLKEFSLIPEFSASGELILNATREQVELERYGCGCFWFTKN